MASHSGASGVGSPPWASGGCPPGFCGHNLGGLPQIPLAYSDFKNFSIFPGGMASHSGESGVGPPPGPLGGAPLGFVVMTWGVCPRPPLPILIFPVFLIFLRFMPPTLVNLEWGAPPGPLGGAPLALVLPLGASCGHAPLHPRTPTPHALMHPCNLTHVPMHLCTHAP